MLNLDHPRVIKVVRIVHLHRRLKELLLKGLRLEPHGTIRKSSFRKVIKLVHHTRVDEVAVLHLRFGLSIVRFQANLDPGMLQHPLKHRCISFPRQGLKLFGDKPVVPIGPDRNPTADRGVQLGGIPPPLLAGVVSEKHLIKLTAHLGQDHLLGIFRVLHGDPPFGQSSFHFLRRRRSSQILLKRIQVDRKLPVLAPGPDQHLVVHLMPVSEPAQIRHHLIGIGPEVMGSVGMDQNPGGIDPVVGVPRQMIPAIHDQNSLSRPLGQSLGQHTSGKAGPHDQIIVGIRHRNPLRSAPMET